MHDGSIFPYRREDVTTDGVTGKGRWSGVLDVPVMGRRAGRCEMRAPRSLRARTKRLSEVSEPMLPRKTSREPLGARTANRHRWVGRTYQGDRENHG